MGLHFAGPRRRPAASIAATSGGDGFPHQQIGAVCGNKGLNLRGSLVLKGVLGDDFLPLLRISLLPLQDSFSGKKNAPQKSLDPEVGSLRGPIPFGSVRSHSGPGDAGPLRTRGRCGAVRPACPAGPRSYGGGAGSAGHAFARSGAHSTGAGFPGARESSPGATDVGYPTSGPRERGAAGKEPLLGPRLNLGRSFAPLPREDLGD